MESAGNAVVSAANQLQNPWQLMVALVVVVVASGAALAWVAYQLGVRTLNRDDDHRKEIMQREQGHADQLNKIREEHQTDLREIHSSMTALMKQTNSVIEHNTRAIEQLSLQLAARRG
jgi:hypothetical protein